MSTEFPPFVTVATIAYRPSGTDEEFQLAVAVQVNGSLSDVTPVSGPMTALPRAPLTDQRTLPDPSPVRACTRSWTDPASWPPSAGPASSTTGWLAAATQTSVAGGDSVPSPLSAPTGATV